MGRATIVVVQGGTERLDDVEPLWKAMHSHHSRVGARPAQVRPFRPAEDSWARRRARYEAWLAQADAFMLIAQSEGAAVGYAFTHVGSGEASIQTGERVAELASLSVLPDWRGQGIGSTLMDAARAELRWRGVTELTLSVMDGNADALRFYERLGMRPYLTTLVGRID